MEILIATVKLQLHFRSSNNQHMVMLSVHKKGKLSQVTYGKVRPEGFGTPGISAPGAGSVLSGG